MFSGARRSECPSCRATATPLDDEWCENVLCPLTAAISDWLTVAPGDPFLGIVGEEVKSVKAPAHALLGVILLSRHVQIS